MTKHLLIPLLVALLVALTLACGDGDDAKEQGAALSPDVARNQEEALDALSTRADQLAQQVNSIRTLSANMETLAVQIEELQLAVAEHRKLTEEALADARGGNSGAGWLTEAWILVIAAAVLLVLFMGLRLLLKGYDRGELPAEAYTPGMRTDAPPIDNETPTPDDVAPEESKEQES